MSITSEALISFIFNMFLIYIYYKSNQILFIRLNMHIMYYS